MEQHHFGYPRRVVEVRPVPVVDEVHGETSIVDSGQLHELGGRVLHMTEYAERRQKEVQAEQEYKLVLH